MQKVWIVQHFFLKFDYKSNVKLIKDESKKYYKVYRSGMSMLREIEGGWERKIQTPHGSRNKGSEVIFSKVSDCNFSSVRFF